MRRRILVVSMVLVIGALAGAMSLDEALGQLKSYRYGQAGDVLQTIQDAALAAHADAGLREKLAGALATIAAESDVYDVRDFACRQLVHVAGAEQAPVLAGLLADERAAHLALYVLAQIPGEAVDRALIDALDAAKGRARLGIITTLGRRGEALSVKPVGAYLGDTDAQTASAAALALGRIGSAEAAEILVGCLESSSAADRRVVVDAYLMCADQMLAQGEDEAAAGMYGRIWDNEKAAPMRCAALVGLVRAGAKDAAAAVLAGLEDPDGKVRRTAAQAVRDSGGNALLSELAAASAGLTPGPREALIRAMGFTGDPQVLAALMLVSRNDPVGVRVAAVEALGYLRHPRGVNRLASALADPEPQVVDAAVQSLGMLRGEDVNRVLVERLKTDPPAARARLIETLSARDAAEAAPVLLELAGGTQPRVAGAAVQALQTLAGEKELEGLLELTIRADASTGLRKAARQALLATVDRTEMRAWGAGRTADECRHADGARKAACVELLGELGHPAGLAALRETLHQAGAENVDDDLRSAAIRAMSLWPDATPAGDLEKIARGSDSRLHRILAVRGIVAVVERSSLPAEVKLQRLKSAMELTEEPGERRAILAAVAKIPSREAMDLAMQQMRAEGTRGEAALAAVTIGEAVYAGEREAVAAAMKEVAAAPVTDDLRKRAQALLLEIESVRSYLTDWDVAGPYMEDGKNCTQLFDIPFAPERGGGVEWKPMPFSRLENHPAYLDLLKQFNGGEQRVAYLRTVIQSEQEQPARLEIFSDDGVKAWLNGKVVHANNTMRPILPEPDVVDVTLRRGTNPLMLKVTQNNLPWGAIVRLRRPQAVQARVGERFKLHVINADSRFEAGTILDVNNDGKLDLLSGGYWYEAPQWKPHLVREIKEEGGYHYDFANLPMDVDGDGWMDTAGAAWHNQMVYWVRNPGAAGGPWTLFEVDTPGNMETAIAADINGDGRQDVLPNIMSAAAWYEYTPDASAENGARWTRHDLPQEASGHGNGAGDVDGDGRCDIVAANGWARQMADGGWQWNGEWQLGSTSVPILVHDVDGDGDSDIVWGMGHNYGIYWLEQGRGADGGRTWAPHAIDESWSQPHFLLLADLDGDGSDDLVTGKRYHAHNGHDPGGNDPVCVYYYTFDRGTGAWTRHVIHEGGRVGLGINTRAADIDGDGDLDLLAPGKSGLYLLENLTRS